MENRFGFKDFVYTVLLLAILLSLWMGIIAFNRQYRLIIELQAQVNQQDRVQARMERALGRMADQMASGVLAIQPGAGAADSAMRESGGDPFARITAAQNHGDFADGDWLVDAFGARVGRLTPLISGDAYSSMVEAYVLESLLTRDPDTLQWQGLLAEDWVIEPNLEAWQAYVDAAQATPLTADALRAEPGFPATASAAEQQAYIEQRLDEGHRLADIVDRDDAPPALTIRFRLRPGLQFSDGEPLTADDVLYTWELITNPDIDAPRARNYFRHHIRDVKVLNEREVVFAFKQPHFEALGMAGGFGAMPRHFYSRFTANDINNRPGLLMGSGPYRLPNPETWTPGELIQLVRNVRYWGPEPNFDRLLFKEITNDVARLTEFTNGDIDRFGATPEQYVRMVQDEDILARADHFNYERPNSGYFYVAWCQDRNGRPTFFADKRVRQAMTMLIDRQRIIDEILEGFGNVVSGPFNRLSNQYDHSIDPWPYDPQRAIALLQEAGFRDRNGDGVLQAPDGQPFRFELIYPSTGETWPRIALLIKDTLARAGIIVDAQGLEWSVFGEKLASNDIDAITLGWTGGIEGDVHQMFHSSNIGGGADNYMHYRNPELDRLIEEARRTLDEEKRMVIWQQVHAILHADQPYTFLFDRDALLFIDKRIENVQRVRTGLNSLLEWYVPEPLQKY